MPARIRANAYGVVVATKAMNEVWPTSGAVNHTVSQIPAYSPGRAMAAAIDVYVVERKFFFEFSSINATSVRCFKETKSFETTVIPSKAPETRRKTDNIDRFVCKAPLMDLVMSPPKHETKTRWMSFGQNTCGRFVSVRTVQIIPESSTLPSRKSPEETIPEYVF